MTTKLWRFNPISGLWVFMRTCESAYAQEWLRVFQADDALGVYRLSNRKPSRKP